MKNLIVANSRPDGKTREQELRTLVDAQLANSLAIGWKPADLLVVTNLAMSLPATVIRAPLNEHCLTGSKMFALEHLFSIGAIHEDEVWWAHDLDAWQNHHFDPPAFEDIGLAEYSTPKFNGGSILLRATCRDLVLRITEEIRQTGAQREEPTINRILRSPEHRSRVTTLNSTYNVGCSAYGVRYERSTQPILVSHFHPSIKSAWRTHVAAANQIGKTSVSPRLVELLVRHFHGGIVPTGVWQVAPRKEPKPT